MSLFARTRHVEQRSTVRIPSQYLMPDYQASAAGILVGTDSAMQSSAVFRCTALIAGTGSQLPVDVVRYGTNNSRVPVNPVPQIVARPSVWVPASGWRYQAISSWLLHGNFYARVTETTPDTRYITRAEIIDPTTVTWTHVDGVLLPHVAGAKASLWPVGDLWHVPAYLVPGSPVGLSPLKYGAEAIGLNLAARRFGAQFFGDGGHPSAILSPATDPGDDGARRLKDRWISATRGNREPAVLPQTVKYERIQVSPEEAQFIDTQRFSIEDICRFFGVPPEMIGAASSGSNVTYANIEQRDLAFLKYGLDPWLTRLEEMLTEQMTSDLTVKVNRSAQLRADTLTRYQAHEIADRIGLLTNDELRRLEDMPPLSPEDLEGQRAWQEVGLPALVEAGLMTTNEARVQLGLPPIAGGDVLRDPTELEEGATP